MDKHFQNAVNMGGRHHIFERPGSDIKKTGYLRKLKTMKKKFFVLRSTSSSGPARLEYYDNEKKFRSGNLPKRSIQLHTCFNINKKTDSRTARFGIVLYTVHDSFTILTECETEQETWLDVMLEYQNEYLPDGDTSKEHYEHVWQVTMQPKGLGHGKGLKGQYRMCLNSTTISLFKVNVNQPQFSIQLVTVRAVGHNDNSFWLELGNYSSTGPGQFWFLVEEAAVAKDMHTTIIQYMASVKDFFDKDQQFAFSKKVIHSGFMDGFGGVSQHYGDSRKSYASSGTYPHDASLDYTMDYSMKQSDGLSDFSHPLCSGDFDGELSCCFDNSLPDHPSMLGHHSLVSNHSVGKHTYNFSELLYPTHLPTVKEGGSGEGHLLSDLPSSDTNSTDFPRPEPATCLLVDESVDLPPRTYSLGSRPTKFQGFSESSSRKVAGNEISRATSAPHIPKGRRERERKMDSPTPVPSPLSMSMKSDDSDSVIEYGPIRPRTASDSFNYRPRTSSFGKPQQNCRPRSSSYGQGKRPNINITKLKLEKAMFSGNVSQRTSRESSLQSSFESLRVSSESLRRPSLELRQPRGTYCSEQNDNRNTPSPQMKNLQPDSDNHNDLGTGVQKSSHFIRTELVTSGRPSDTLARRCDHQSHSHEHSRGMTPATCGSGNDDVYMNIDFGTQSTSNNDDIKPLPAAARSQHPRVEANRYINVDMGNRNKKSHGGRSLSVENVDTYFISDLPFTVNKPRTGSVGSKDKQMLRPDSARKSIPVSSSSVAPSSCTSSSSIPIPSSSTHSSSIPIPSSSECIYQHSLASMSSHSFGGSDSTRRPPCLPSSEKHGLPDFRQKSGSTGSRPNTLRSFFGMTSGKEQRLPASVPMRKSSLPRFTDDEIAGEYIEFPFPDSARDSTSGCHSHSDLAQPGVVLSNSTKSGKESSIAQSGPNHFCPLPVQSDPAAPSKVVTSVNSNPASLSPSSSSSPCRLTSLPVTSSTKDTESYVLYEPPVPTTSSQQETSHLQFHCPNLQKVQQTAEPTSTSTHSDTTEEYINFQPMTSQGEKPEYVAHDHADCKLSVSSGAPGKDAASTQNYNGYLVYQPGSVSCEEFKHLTPDSAFSYVPTSSRTIASAKLKQRQTSSSIPTKGSLSHKAATNADLFHIHNSNTSGDPWDMDPEPLSGQTFQYCFQPFKTQSLDKSNATEHRQSSSSSDINGLPPTGLGPKHHVSRCDENVSNGTSSNFIKTLSKENFNLSSSPASGTNKYQQTPSNNMTDISSAADAMSSSGSFDSLTHDSTPVVNSVKSAAISRNAKHPRHSLGDIFSVTRVPENRSPTSTCNISALDDLQVNRKSGFRRSLTDCDFMEVTSEVTSHN